MVVCSISGTPNTGLRSSFCQKFNRSQAATSCKFEMHLAALRAISPAAHCWHECGEKPGEVVSVWNWQRRSKGKDESPGSARVRQPTFFQADRRLPYLWNLRPQRNPQNPSRENFRQLGDPFSRTDLAARLGILCACPLRRPTSPPPRSAASSAAPASSPPSSRPAVRCACCAALRR